MRTLFRALLVPIMVVAGVSTSVLVPGSAAAADKTGDIGIQVCGHNTVPPPPWLEDPAVVPNPQTSLGYSFSRGTVQIRYGTYAGVQYGWGRALNPANTNHWVRFEVDTNGDRVWDKVHAVQLWWCNYTWGHPTSNSSAVAFRACIVVVKTDGCVSGSNGTYWW